MDGFPPRAGSRPLFCCPRASSPQTPILAWNTRVSGTADRIAEQRGIRSWTGVILHRFSDCRSRKSVRVGPFDLICANLPYVPREGLADLAVAQREPRRALDGGAQGLALIQALLADLPRLISPGGRALLEIDEGHGDRVLEMARIVLPAGKAQVLPDLAGKDRLLVVDAEELS